MIPAELRDLDQWVTWRREGKPDGKPTKVPYRPDFTSGKASHSDPATWGSYAEAVATASSFEVVHGYGYVFAADDPYCGLDFDNCLDADGNLNPTVAAMVADLDSYTEVSPSGTGLHIIVRGLWPGPRHVKNERPGTASSRGTTRFAISPSLVISGSRRQPRSRTDSSSSRRPVPGDVPAPTTPSPRPSAAPVTASDKELLDRMFGASNGVSIRALWSGDTSRYDGDDSAADMALVDHLAFWTGGDAQRIDRLFRRSALMRAKWDERRGDQTYGHHHRQGDGGRLDQAQLHVRLQECRTAPTGRCAIRSKSGCRKNASDKGSVLTPFSHIVAKPVQWLWRDRIALGKLTAIAGRPKIGKGLLTTRVVAQVTRGSVEGDLDAPKGAVILTTEDDEGDTLKPRLMAAGADLDRVFTLSMGSREEPVPFRVPQDADALRWSLQETEAALVVIDPLIEFIDGKVDSHKSHPVRQAVASLNAIAKDTGCAVVVIFHLNKGTSTDPLLRHEGTAAFTQIVRGGMLLGHDPDDPEGESGDRRVLAVTSSNLARIAPSLLFQIHEHYVMGDTGELIATARMDYIEESNATGSDLLKPHTDEDAEPSALEEAIEFLTAELQPVRSKQPPSQPLLGPSESRWRPSSAPRTARDQVPQGRTSGPWFWCLPQDAHTPLSTLENIEDEHLGESPEHWGFGQSGFPRCSSPWE